MEVNDQYHKYRVYHQDFIIDKRYQVTKELGHGAYGIVCAASYQDEHGGGSVAIKKVTNIFSKKILCKRALRELKLLKHFRGHKNITCLYDLDIIPDVNGNFNEIYLYEELMECDMHQIIRSKQPLTDQHYQSFIYQILCGLKYIHSADVLHRDLKPGNLLVNADCELKICDFGLARGYSNDPEKNSGFLTEYVATRWYRLPEIMLSFQSYTKSIDIWSVGCILLELLGGKPIFRGRDYVDQLNQILCIVGTPKESTLTRIGSKRAQSYVKSLPYMPKVPYSKLYPNANLEGLDLLEKMLTLDPQERITVDEALKHPYLRIWNDPTDEPSCQSKFDFSFEVVDDMDLMKRMIIDEVTSFREFVRRPIEEQHLIQYNSNNSVSPQNDVVNDQLLQLQLQQQLQLQLSYYNNYPDQQQQQQQTMDFDQQSPIIFHQQSSTLSLQQQQFQGDFIIPDGETLPELGYQVPRPQENTDPGDIFNLEQELEYGLDRYGGRSD